MQVGHMQQSDVAVVIERQQRILGHALLRGGAADRSKPQRRRCGANLQHVPTGNHTLLMPDSRHVELEPGVDRGEVKLEIAVWLGVRRQLVGPYRDVAPFEALANVPDRLLARTPGWEVIELPALLAQPLAADPFKPAA